MASAAYGSPHDAFNSAVATGGNAEKAKTAANDAVSAALATVKRQQEEANGIILLHCKSLPGGIGYDECIRFAQMSDADKAMRVLDNDWLCMHTANMGQAFQRECFANETSPTFGTDLAFTAAAKALNELGAIYTALGAVEGVTIGAVLCSAFQPCNLLALSIIPEGTVFSSWMAIVVGDAFIITRIGGIYEELFVDAEVTEASIVGDVVAGIRGCRCRVGDILGDPSRLNGWIPTEIPAESRAVISDIEKYGVEAQGAGPQHMGPIVPRDYENGRPGSTAYRLPLLDGRGKPIEYREWGTVQSASNPKPGGERIVTGSDGSIYYSPTHYQTFIVARPGR